MNWDDIVSIVFVCVTMNHLGLIGAIEGKMGFRIPILNCPKCASFWFTLVYGIGKMGFSIIPQIPLVLAMSFFASYIAIWFELFEGFIDTLYIRAYEKVYSTTDTGDEVASDANEGNSKGSLSDVRKVYK